MSKILVIEDNDTMRDGICRIINKLGYESLSAVDGLSGLELVKEHDPDLVITDFKMEKMNGMEVLDKVKEINPDIAVIIITAYGTVDTAVEAMKKGASDFITKDFSIDELKMRIEKVLQMQKLKKDYKRLSNENEYLRETVSNKYNFGEIVGKSQVMQDIYKTIEKVAESNSSVLIYGESGTGKELVARAIHCRSPRKDKPFIKVHCGALAEGVLESELFGHEKGAFTGAMKRKIGRFELADEGTIFLDEIGDITPATQIKLLRILQEKEFERVGGEHTIKVDVRVIAATNKDLLKEVELGNFREDLYYRLHIIPINLPPIREHKEDIPILVNHFITKLAKETNKNIKGISDSALQILMDYDWPGNVRELENVIERAMVLCEGDTITPQDLPVMTSIDSVKLDLSSKRKTLDETLDEVEKQLIEKAYKQANGIKSRAAKILGIKTSALYYKLEKYGII